MEASANSENILTESVNEGGRQPGADNGENQVLLIVPLRDKKKQRQFKEINKSVAALARRIDLIEKKEEGFRGLLESQDHINLEL